MATESQPIPLALFVYKRPRHTYSALRALGRCDEIEKVDIYIYCDGPKGAADASLVFACREVVRNWAAGKPNVTIVERKTNMGLDPSVVHAVTDLCKQYGRVIVLEDDFLVSPDFLTYMRAGLERYQHNTEVCQVSGYMYPCRLTRRPTDTFFLPMGTSRGWGTWKRAWDLFDWAPNGFREDLKNEDFRFRFDCDGTYGFSNSLEWAMKQENGPWDLRFQYAIFKRGGVVLYPRKSLVWIGGWDGTGTHCNYNFDFYQPPRVLWRKRRLGTPLTFPREVCIDDSRFNELKEFFRKQSRQRRTLFGRIRRRLAVEVKRRLPFTY